MAGIKVITRKVRLNYANLFTPRAVEEGEEPRYSASILIEKSDIITINKIKEAIEKSKENGKILWNHTIPDNLKLPIKDGDIEKADKHYLNNYFINTSAKYKPGIVDINLNEIINPKEIYSGCYVRCAISFYPYRQDGNYGIGCSIENIQKLADGEILGRSSAIDDFSTPYEEDILI